MNTIKKRKLISFSGYCSVNCKHCYTHDLTQEKKKSDNDEITDIITELDDDDDSFDVIYVSRSRENFINEDAGTKLVEKIYQTHKKHIFIITRKCLSDSCIARLAKLNERMKETGLLLSVAVSIPANNSYAITEDVTCIATPEERCDCIRRLHSAGVKTIFMARPVFPNSIIPVNELIDMIKDNAPYINAVVASGLAVNDKILERLQLEKERFNYLPGNNTEFLIGANAKDIKYIDVTPELRKIQKCCQTYDLPFSTHSMQALNDLVLMS